MAVNKNFVVKNGLEVATNAVLVDATSKNVGIGSTLPANTLDVRGGIGATDIIVTGVSSFRGDVQVGVSGSIFYVDDSTDNVGVGTSLPAYTLDVRGPVSSGTTALYVYGDAHVTGDLIIDDFVLQDLYLTGISTFVGFSTFQDFVFVKNGFNVGGGATFGTLNVSGVSTFGGNVDINSFADISGNVRIGGISTIANYALIESGLNVTGVGATTTTLNVTGVSTFVGFSTFNDYVFIQDGLNVTGVSSVGAAITMYPTSGIVSATSFYGDGSNLSGVSTDLTATIGVSSEGTFVGAGATIVDFKSTTGTNVQSVDLNSGIATVTIQPGVSIGLAIALGG